MDKNTNRVLQEISAATREAKHAARHAGEELAERYSELKINFELLKLQSEQDDVFHEIGKLLFALHTKEEANQGEKSPRQMIDTLLIQAEQIQQEMDALEESIEMDPKENSCSHCGHSVGGNDTYCAACGKKLKQELE